MHVYPFLSVQFTGWLLGVFVLQLFGFTQGLIWAEPPQAQQASWGETFLPLGMFAAHRDGSISNALQVCPTAFSYAGMFMQADGLADGTGLADGAGDVLDLVPCQDKD